MFSSLLPKPKYSSHEPSSRIKLKKVRPHEKSNQLVKLPENKSDIKVMDNPSNSESTISQLYLNPDGTLNYNLTIASSNGNSRKVQSSYEDTIPLKVKFPNLKHHFPRYTVETCPDDSLRECVEDTKAAINKMMNEKMGIDEKTNKKDDVTYIKYTSNNLVKDPEGSDDERGRERIIQIRNYQEDPMLPPKFKLRKNRHKNPSPPPPLLKSSNNEQTSKLTKEDQAKWQIPSAISNWKNNQGFTISLDKRMVAANGGSELATNDVNLEKFGELSEALENADKQAREEIKIRSEMLKQLAIKEQHEKENKLKELADIARSKKLNNKRPPSRDYDDVKKKPKY
ncbi:unnamed protein product [Debaryomyces tyrocola]|nr:unnamed protein product [Debaryomyces tyrocola]